VSRPAEAARWTAAGHAPHQLITTGSVGSRRCPQRRRERSDRNVFLPFRFAHCLPPLLRPGAGDSPGYLPSLSPRPTSLRRMSFPEVSTEQTAIYDRPDGPLDREFFDRLLEAPVVIEPWKCEYNQNRPHSSSGHQTLEELTARCLAAAGASPLPASRKPKIITR
jgi:hypothetical protein